MRPHLALLVILGACSSATSSTEAPGEGPTASPTPTAAEAAGSAARTAAAPSAADEAALALRAQVGDPYGQRAIEFSFVVRSLAPAQPTAGDTPDSAEPVAHAELLRRRYRWEPLAKRVTILHRLEPFTLDISRDLGPFVSNPHEHADLWSEVAPDQDPVVASQAYAAFINDSFWLIAPYKLADEGAERSLLPDGRLQVRYAAGGVTPGDTYTVTLGSPAEPITRWEYQLASGRQGEADWSGWHAFGPLRLATRHPAGAREIALEDIRVERPEG